MKTSAKYRLAPLLLLLLFAPAAFAQETPPAAPADPPAFTQAELDQMLAPIALYPDSLLSHILMASTYPLEIVQAARWSRANPGLEGEEAVRAVEEQDWDPSVKSLVAFPRILATMDEKLEWMQDLGDAFLAQPAQVMDTVQGLRQKAYAAGNLQSSGQYRIEQQGRNIVIASAYPEVVYVPYYDPRVVYGPWWRAAYPPVYWAPWPGYYAYPGFAGFHWSVGIFVGPRFFFGIWDWHHRHVRVVHVHHHVQRHRRALPPKVWRHNPHHRRGVAYRHPSVHQKFVRAHGVPPVKREFRKHFQRSPDGRRHLAKRPDARPGLDARRPEHRRRPPSPAAGAGAHPKLEARFPRNGTSKRPDARGSSVINAPAVSHQLEQRRSLAARAGTAATHPKLNGASRLGSASRLQPQAPAVRSVPVRPDGPGRAARPAPQSPHLNKGLNRGRSQANIRASGQPGLHRKVSQLGSAPAARSSARVFAPEAAGGSRGFSKFQHR